MDFSQEELSTEIWADVPGTQRKYRASTLGRIKSMNFNRTGVEALLSERNNGIHMCLNGTQVRMTRADVILLTFVGPKPEGHLSRHYDDDPWNNRLENLLYGTVSDNVKDSYRNNFQRKSLLSASLRRYHATLPRG